MEIPTQKMLGTEDYSYDLVITFLTIGEECNGSRLLQDVVLQLERWLKGIWKLT